MNSPTGFGTGRHRCVAARTASHRLHGSRESIMKLVGMRKVLYHAGSALGVIDKLPLLGCFVVWLIGLETITRFYENKKPLVLCAAAGVVLIGLGILLSALAGGKDLIATAPRTDTAQGASSEGGIPCDNCHATNDLGAKFCDQCGTALAGR
jgi:hypothetical protein